MLKEEKIKSYINSLGYKQGKDFSVATNSFQTKVTLKNISIPLKSVQKFCERLEGSTFVRYEPKTLEQAARKYVQKGDNILNQMKNVPNDTIVTVDEEKNLKCVKISSECYNFLYNDETYYFSGEYTILEPLAIIYAN